MNADLLLYIRKRLTLSDIYRIPGILQLDAMLKVLHQKFLGFMPKVVQNGIRIY